MRRNMDLVRSILLYIEERTHLNTTDQIKIAGFTDDEVNYHILLLYEDDYIDGQKLAYGRVIPMRMFSKAHDFLDAARNETIWNKAKKEVKDKGVDVPISMMKDLLILYVKQSFNLD